MDADFTHCLSLPYEDYRGLPDCPTVYIIYKLPQLVLYIGSTGSLKKRIPNEHLRRFKPVSDVHIAWYPLPPQFHKTVERELIRKYDPLFNDHYRTAGSIRLFSGEQVDLYLRNEWQDLCRVGSGLDREALIALSELMLSK